MELSLPKKELQDYIRKQLDAFFPDGFSMKGEDVDTAFDRGLLRLENCFSYLTFPSYYREGQTYFSHMHGDQYAQLLYYFSNSLWELSENKPVCDKLIGLNRLLHDFTFSYKGKLPDIFFLGHPIGSVLGNAAYDDFLVVFHHVTVNTAADKNGNPAPILGKGLFLAAGSKVIGNKPIGDCVSIGVDALVYDKEIPSHKVVIRDETGAIQIKEQKKSKCMAQNYFNVDIEGKL